MNFTCKKQHLQDALSLAIRAVSSRTTMPILECVLLTASSDNGLTLSASNLELSIDTEPIEATVTTAGSIAVDAKLFSDIVRKMPGDSVTIDVDEKGSVQVKSGRSKLMVNGQHGDEFPVTNPNDIVLVNEGIAIKNKDLKDMINQTIFSVSTDTSRPILTGELIEVKDDTMCMVAIDMSRISYRSVKLSKSFEGCKVVVPAKALSELSRMLSANEEEDVLIQLTEKRVIFTTELFKLTSNLLEGEFIRYDQIFNEDFSTVVEINRLDLLNAFERAILVATEGKTLPINLEITEDDLTVKARSERGETEEGVPCSTEGKDLNISFNPMYFIQCLRAVEEENVILRFNTQLSPCTIKGSGDNSADYKYLIVPLRPQ